MKKLISICLCAIMLLTMIPIGASASETNLAARNNLITLACEVFPEFADAIRSENINNSTIAPASASDEVIYTETREVSDSKRLTLSQYASGSVIVISQELSDFPIEIVDSSTSDISTVGVAGTASFEMKGPGTGYFKLNNVAFTIYYNASDYFTSYGSTSSYNVCFGTTTKESTQIEYNLVFNCDGHQFTAPFQLYFSNNKLVARTY